MFWNSSLLFTYGARSSIIQHFNKFQMQFIQKATIAEHLTSVKLIVALSNFKLRINSLLCHTKTAVVPFFASQLWFNAQNPLFSSNTISVIFWEQKFNSRKTNQMHKSMSRLSLSVAHTLIWVICSQKHDRFLQHCIFSKIYITTTQMQLSCNFRVFALSIHHINHISWNSLPIVRLSVVRKIR